MIMKFRIIKFGFPKIYIYGQTEIICIDFAYLWKSY